MSLAAFSPHAASNKQQRRRGGRGGGGEDDNDSSTRSQYTIPTIGQFVIDASLPPPAVHVHVRGGDGDTYDDTYGDDHDEKKKWQHLYVLPVLLLEFLAIALTRAVLPSILLQEYGSRVYLVLGCADCIRGFLAFLACPLFGKLSDMWGRRLCLLITVMGSCAPVCSLALFSWQDEEGEYIIVGGGDNSGSDNQAQRWLQETYSTNSTSTLHQQQQQQLHYTLPPMAIPIFVVLLSLSGIFSSTFTLVFAYISDTVRQREERVAAYGLALATFGLSFTIGPMAGGYLAQCHTHYVFICSLVLTILDVLYIYFILPESKTNLTIPPNSNMSFSESASALLFQRQADISWSPWDSMRMVLQDPFLKRVGQVAFFYYTGLWAVISTLSIYAVQQFHLTPERLGELMSALGLCTMVAEAVLVRVMVPLLGEKQATRIGLLSFTGQCIVLGFAYEDWHLFVCVGFSLLGNLVYPSLSSLVSEMVEPDAVGEALGAINGIKALTEGIGPLFFGALMTVSEGSTFPGWPYWVAAVMVMVAYRLAGHLPDDNNHKLSSGAWSVLGGGGSGGGGPASEYQEDYIHELEFKQRSIPFSSSSSANNNNININNGSCLPSLPTPVRDDHDEEYKGLLSLSEIEEDDDDDDDNDDENDNNQAVEERRSGLTQITTTLTSTSSIMMPSSSSSPITSQPTNRDIFYASGIDSQI